MSESRKYKTKMEEIIEKAKESKDNIVVLDEPETTTDFDKINSINVPLLKKQIIKIKTEISNNRGLIPRNILIPKYKYLYDNYPLIFNMAADNKNVTVLFKMLESIERIQKDKTKYDNEFEKVKSVAWDITYNTNLEKLKKENDKKILEKIEEE